MICEQTKHFSRVILFSGTNRYEVGVKYHDAWYGSCYLKITKMSGPGGWIKPTDLVNHSSFSDIAQASKWAAKLLKNNTPYLNVLAYGYTYWNKEITEIWENKYNESSAIPSRG